MHVERFDLMSEGRFKIEGKKGTAVYVVVSLSNWSVLEIGTMIASCTDLVSLCSVTRHRTRVVVPLESRWLN